MSTGVTTMERRSLMDIDVRAVKGHYEIYINGVFYCSCDTKDEVDEELKNL